MTEKIQVRDNSISYVRLVAMVMIIFCHFFQYYGNELAFWFNSGVQVFFIISGYLYGSKDISDPVGFVLRQFKKILVPYYLYLIPISVIYIIFSRADFSLKKFINAVFCVGTLDGLGHLWFIGYILFCYLITPYLFWLRKKLASCSLVKISAVYIVVLFCVIVTGTLTDSYFQPHRVCCYIVGFMLSSLRNKYGNVVVKITGSVSVTIGLLFNIIRVYIKYFYNLPTGTLIYKIFMFSEPYLHLLLGLALFFILYYAFSKVDACSLVIWSDKYSFSIYIVHQTFILSPFSTMSVTPISPINWVITLASILLSGVMLHYLTGFNLKKFYTQLRR